MSIRQEVQQELTRGDVGEEIRRLVLAALEGEDAIEKVLAGEEEVLAGESVETSETAPDNEEQVSPVYLRDITVSGFRGIGPETTLEISPGPGLTVVVGRNGSGKSSFSEALEVLLTGDSYRWMDKPKSWERGWKNLHQGDNPKIIAHFQVEGMNEQTVIQRIWDHSSKLEESKFSVQHNGHSHSSLAEIGWEKPLDIYRPILSYNELSRIYYSRPIDFYNILSRVLGLEELSYAIDELSKTRSRRGDEKKIIKQLKENIVPKLNELDDEIAKKVSDMISGSNWDWGTIEKIIDNEELDSSYSNLRELQEKISIPDKEQVTKVVNNLNDARISLANLSGTESEQAEQLVVLLKQAVEHYKGYRNQRCPVCRVGVLDDAWYTDVSEQIKDLENTAQSYQNAKKSKNSALEETRQVLSVPDLPVSDMVNTDELIYSWNQWVLLLDSEDNVSEHLLSQYSVVRDIATKVSEEVNHFLSDRENKRKSFLPDLRTLVSEAYKADKERQEVGKIEQASNEIKTIMRKLQSFRWSHIEKQVLNLWEDLRLDSSVSLRSVKLVGLPGKGKGNVDLSVKVDGIDAAALSVASQGELSCLALSLFFPRAMLSASPFRFLIIDDPIQSMDPARVYELARLFAKIAEERQLIVFTHDDRLPESLRLLNLDYLCLEVIRDPDSKVKVEKNRDPVIRYFCDAFSVIDDNHLKRAIPGFCRSGLEAACVEAVRRRRLNAGESHESIEEMLSKATILCQRASLVLFNEDNRCNKVFNTIKDKWGEDLAKAYSATNKGSHSGYSGDLSNKGLRTLINNCLELAEKLRYYDV